MPHNLWQIMKFLNRGDDNLHDTMTAKTDHLTGTQADHKSPEQMLINYSYGNNYKTYEIPNFSLIDRNVH